MPENVCPHCGYCPHCGRSNAQPYPWWGVIPPYESPWSYPWPNVNPWPTISAELRKELGWANYTSGMQPGEQGA